jgi:endo-1,4-beta-xylanase
VFENAQGQPLTRDELLARMKEHISTVVGRYKGRIKGWDVVNEALNEDGTLRQSPWMRIIGPDYLARRSSSRTRRIPPRSCTTTTTTSTIPPSATAPSGSCARCSRRRADPRRRHPGAPEAHDAVDRAGRLEHPAHSATGVKVNVTELDIDMLPRATRNATRRSRCAAAPHRISIRTRQGCPTRCSRRSPAGTRSSSGSTSRNGTSIDRVTFWGVADHDSWLNGWPVAGARTIRCCSIVEQAEARLSARDGASRRTRASARPMLSDDAYD